MHGNLAVRLPPKGGSLPTRIKILNILKRNNKTLKCLISEFPQFFICRTKIDCPMDIYPIILEKIKEKVKEEFKDARIDDIDGLKIWKDDNTWILFRPSSNAPEFRVFTEANTEDEALKSCKESIAFVAYVRDANMRM